MNLKTSLVLLLMFSVSHFSNGQRNKKYFREDYKFIEATQSFYKIHTIPRPWLHAKRICAQEGASLFYPEDDAEAQAVLGFWKATQPFNEVNVGISALVVKGVFESIDGMRTVPVASSQGIPVAVVYHNWAPGEPNDGLGNEDCVAFKKDSTYNDVPCSWKYPFICKKSLVSLEWNEKCNIPDLDYTLNEQLGRCYKFHLKPLNWPDAYTVCNAEQSYLAVIDTQQEVDYLVAITDQAPKRQVTDNMTEAVLLGFHERLDDGWHTVKGTPLEDSGYSKWAPGQPDGPHRGVDERCGSMFYNGLLNDIQCDRACYFICEHEVKNLSSAFDDRDGVEKR